MKIKDFVTDKKNLPVFIIIICALIVFIIFGGGESSEKTAETTQDPAATLEKRLERVLSRVDGVGKVSVFVSLEDYGATDYVKDTHEILEKEQSESEKTTVLKGSGSSASPVISRITSPKVKGVIVVAEGAENQMVKANLAAAVEASLAIMPHRIKILEGNN